MQLETIKDVVAHRVDNWKESDGRIEAYDVSSKSLKINGHEYVANDFSTSQLFSANCLGLSGTKREFETDPIFFQEAVNKKIALQEGDVRIIFDNASNEIKGLKTPSYCRLPDGNVLEFVLKEYGNTLNEKRSFINDKCMQLHFDSRVQIKAAVGDLVGYGFMIQNSEVGFSSLITQGSLLRLTCKNGAVSKERVDVNYQSHRVDLKDLIPSLVAKVYNPTLMASRLEKAASKEPFIQMREGAEKVLKNFGVPQKYHDAIFHHIATEPVGVKGDLINGWGLQNGVSRFLTHEFPAMHEFDPITSTEMSSNAFSLLTL